MNRGRNATKPTCRRGTASPKAEAVSTLRWLEFNGWPHCGFARLTFPSTQLSKVDPRRVITQHDRRLPSQWKPEVANR